jgi:hypothetical protein
MRKIFYVLSLLMLFILASCTNRENASSLDGTEQTPPQWDELKTRSQQAFKESAELLKTITDSEFLQTTEPMSDKLLEMSDPATELREKRAYNGVIYYKALERVRKHSFEKDNQIYTTLKSGSEVNIAEDLFNYITDTLYVFWNELLKDGAAEIIYENELITIGIIPKKKQDKQVQ